MRDPLDSFKLFSKFQRSIVHKLVTLCDHFQKRGRGRVVIKITIHELKKSRLKSSTSTLTLVDFILCKLSNCPCLSALFHFHLSSTFFLTTYPLHFSFMNFSQPFMNITYGTPLGIMTFFSFIRLCMKFSTSFAFIKLSFPKIILTSYNVANIRLLGVLRKTLSRPSFKSACLLKRVYLDQPAQS